MGGVDLRLSTLLYFMRERVRRRGCSGATEIAEGGKRES
jgi:hypothetical protein